MTIGRPVKQWTDGLVIVADSPMTYWFYKTVQGDHQTVWWTGISAYLNYIPNSRAIGSSFRLQIKCRFFIHVRIFYENYLSRSHLKFSIFQFMHQIFMLMHCQRFKTQFLGHYRCTNHFAKCICLCGDNPLVRSCITHFVE